MSSPPAATLRACVQGMSYLAAMLVLAFDGDAFRAFVSLANLLAHHFCFDFYKVCRYCRATNNLPNFDPSPPPPSIGCASSWSPQLRPA